MDDLPTLSVDLIDALAAEFPARCISRGQSVEDAHRYAGKRELVEYLLDLKLRDSQQFPKR